MQNAVSRQPFFAVDEANAQAVQIVCANDGVSPDDCGLKSLTTYLYNICLQSSLRGFTCVPVCDRKEHDIIFDNDKKMEEQHRAEKPLWNPYFSPKKITNAQLKNVGSVFNLSRQACAQAGAPEAVPALAVPKHFMNLSPTADERDRKRGRRRRPRTIQVVTRDTMPLSSVLHEGGRMEIILREAKKHKHFIETARLAQDTATLLLHDVLLCVAAVGCTAVLHKSPRPRTCSTTSCRPASSAASSTCATSPRCGRTAHFR